MGLSFSKLISDLFGNKEMRIVMFGLGAAGKTTILYKLKLGKIITTMTTIGFGTETIIYNDVNFIMMDVGAYQYHRLREILWRHYFNNIKGVIYVVDGTDRDRIDEARDELHKLLNEDELKDAELLVFANKKDLPNAMNSVEITNKLGLHSFQQRSWYIQSTSATTGEGLYEGLDWLSNRLSNKA